MPDHSPKNKADAMTTCGCPEVKPEESAADEAGDPHATERDEIASGSESVDACMASSPLPPLPPSSPAWQPPPNIYNTKSRSSSRCVIDRIERRERGEAICSMFFFGGTQKNIKHKKTQILSFMFIYVYLCRFRILGLLHYFRF